MVDGQVPFTEWEAERFPYSQSWQMKTLGNEEGAYRFPSLRNPVVIVQTGLRTPADVEGGMDMLFRPFHDLTQFIPVLHIGERHLLHRCASDDHTVEVVVSDLVKGLVKGQKMFL